MSIFWFGIGIDGWRRYRRLRIAIAACAAPIGIVGVVLAVRHGQVAHVTAGVCSVAVSIALLTMVGRKLVLPLLFAESGLSTIRGGLGERDPLIVGVGAFVVLLTVVLFAAGLFARDADSQQPTTDNRQLKTEN